MSIIHTRVHALACMGRRDQMGEMGEMVEWVTHALATACSRNPVRILIRVGQNENHKHIHACVRCIYSIFRRKSTIHMVIHNINASGQPYL